MHDYLRAIGFSEYLNKKELHTLLYDCMTHAEDKHIIKEMQTEKNSILFGECFKEVAKDMGICICGTFNEAKELEMDYYFPYLKGNGITSTENMEFCKYIGKNAYAGLCDDVRVGVTLIFYLQNAGFFKKHMQKGEEVKEKQALTLSGLSISGAVLLPLTKPNMPKDTIEEAMRNELRVRARQGDEAAIETLTMEDMDTYSMISRRIQKEDLYTIVDTYFMPYGLESDLYSIMGEIIEVRPTVNMYTKEELYVLCIRCSGLCFDVCINKKDLLGEPKKGRRFKGNIWLQGILSFL